MSSSMTKSTMRTETEMFPVVKDWMASGLTQKEYSLQHGLPTHILPYWVGRYRQTSTLNEEVPARFVQVSTAAPSAADMEIQWPNGTVLRLQGPVSAAWLKKLLGPCSP